MPKSTVRTTSRLGAVLGRYCDAPDTALSNVAADDNSKLAVHKHSLKIVDATPAVFAFAGHCVQARSPPSDL